jgi:hypothetical protein
MATHKPLRLGAIELQAFIDDARIQAAKRREGFLKANNDWSACIVEGCTGVVKPAFVRRTADGRRYGYCPRRTTHQRLMPGVFTN